MKNKILIFAATYNEAGNIKSFLDSINNLNLDIDLLIIDDNSPDKTWRIIQNYSTGKKNIHLILRDKKEGLDTAHKTAFDYSIKNNYDLLITMDADLSHDPKAIPQFINELKTNAFVIGSRYIAGGKNDMKGFRLLLSILGNKIIKFSFKIDCTEYTSSYRGFNLKEIGNFNLNTVSSKGYSFFMETIFQINKKGIKIKQIPIHFAHREKGESKIPKIEIFRTLLNIFKLKLQKN